MATIAEEINDLKSRVSSAYDACEAKGATIPTEKTTWNLSSTIESIPSGGAEMPTFYGVPISAFLPYMSSSGVWKTPPSDENYCLDISADSDGDINFEDSTDMTLFKRLLGAPGDYNKYKDIVATPILSVIWRPTRIRSKFSYTEMFSAVDNWFSGIMYNYVSFPNIEKYIYLRNGSNTFSRPLGHMFYGSYIRHLDLPLYQGDSNFCLSAISLRHLYAPSLSTFGEKFLAGNNALTACTIQRDSLHTKYTEMLNGCAKMKALPIDCVGTGTDLTSTSLKCDRLAKGMTSLKDVKLSASLGASNLPYSFIGSFQNCTSLSSATIYFTNRNDSVLCCCTNLIMSGMFEGCSNLKKAEIRGITHFGTPTGYNTSQGATKMMSGTRSDSELWFPDLQVITGGTSASSVFQKWATLGCKDLYFPKVSDIRNRYVFGGLGAETTGIHFAAANEAALKATAGWQYQWTAPGTCTIYFDL